MNTFFQQYKKQLFAALAIVIFLSATALPAIRSNLGATDFAVFYAAGVSVLSIGEAEPADMFVNKKRFKETIDRYRPGISGGTKFLYLPPATLFFTPLAIIPYPIALHAWAVCVALAFIAAYYASIYVLLKDHDLLAPKYSALLILFAFSTSASRLMQTGQVNSILWLLLVLFFFGMYKKRPWITGITLAVTIFLKVFPVIFVPLLIIKKQWKALGITIAIGLLLTVLGIGVLGTKNIQPYVQNTLVNDILLTKPSTEGSTLAANSWKTVTTYKLKPRKIYRQVIEKTSTLLTILSLLLTYFLFWKKRDSTQNILGEYTAFILIILLFPLFTHVEWMLWLIPLCIWGIVQKKRWIQILSVVMIALTQFWEYTAILLAWQPIIKTVTIGVLLACIIWVTTFKRDTSALPT